MRVGLSVNRLWLPAMLSLFAIGATTRGVGVGVDSGEVCAQAGEDSHGEHRAVLA